MIKGIIKKMSFEQKAQMLTYYSLLDTMEFEEFGIPKMVMADGPHGVRPLAGTPESIKGGSTAYPTASALSSTWNLTLAYETGASLGRECLAQGVDVLLGPGVNLKRSPLCGRNFEYFSEDPVLSGEMGAGYIKGLEAQGVGSCLKHYALNNQEFARTLVNVEVDERTLHEIYLKPFEIAVKKGKPASIMAAYNQAFGKYCSQNKKLFDILRNEWNYEGAIISDWGAVKDAVASFKAGLNLQMPSNKNLADQLKAGIEKGDITESKIDEALEKLLEFIFHLKDSVKCADKYDREKQQQDSYKVAKEAITLLKNDNNILPVTKEKYKKIFVLGGWAEKPQIMGGGSSIIWTADERIASPLEEIKKAAGDDIEIIYQDCYTEIDKANLAGTTVRGKKLIKDCTDDDLVLLFVSSPNAETEGLDRHTLYFENYINDIIRAYAINCKNVAVVMQTGTAYTPYAWDKSVGAIVQMWLCGEAGGQAIADILFGKVNPSGKLSETFPSKLRENFEHIGLEDTITYKEGFEIGYRYYDKHPEEIWFPFGHGLSYTSFEYSNLNAKVEDKSLKISFDIKNIGDMDGKETAQVYIGKKDSAFVRPIKELKAFSKTEIKAGETKTVSILLPVSDLAIYNETKWEVENGEYEIYIGASSQDIKLNGKITL
ncbi:MAG: glycoside hydrolase family 3 protein [Clostridia bacterium]|nr:glycoside hydrolase family 3 protein [Clostridia bacterium]